MTLELKKFDMKNISFKPNENKGPVVVLIGKRDTGKSFLVRDLLFYQQEIPIGTVISGTEEGNGFYAKMVPKLFVHNEYNTAIIENILKRQRTVLKQIKKEMETLARLQRERQVAENALASKAAAQSTATANAANAAALAAAKQREKMVQYPRAQQDLSPAGASGVLSSKP